MANIEQKVEDLVSNVIEGLGYDLYDVEYIKEGKDYFLRIFIDRENGIDLNDCETVNNAIIDILDEADYIKDQYFLEISSPGVERVLRKDKHLEANIGNLIKIHLFKSENRQKEITGILDNFNEENIYLKQDEEVIDISRKNISLIKTVYDW